MLSSWTDSTDRQLLLSIIHASAVPTPKWDRIALLMGPGYTAEAVRQRFQKLKKAGKQECGGRDEVGSTGGAAKGTARKRKGTGQGEEGAVDEGGRNVGKQVKLEPEGEDENGDGDVDEFS